MDWLSVIAIGFIIGTIFSFIAQGARMPQSLCIALGLAGAVAGGALVSVTGFYTFGSWSFQIAGAALSLGFLAGGLLAYNITSDERRV